MDEIAAAAGEVQRHFPQIYFACHVQHTRRRSTAYVLSVQDSVYLGHLDRSRPTSPRHLARLPGQGGPACIAAPLPPPHLPQRRLGGLGTWGLVWSS